MGMAVGIISQRQGCCLSWGGIWRKPTAKSRPDEQEPHMRLTWSGRVCITKRNPILPELQAVNGVY